jgi:hypothetical protein
LSRDLTQSFRSLRETRKQARLADETDRIYAIPVDITEARWQTDLEAVSCPAAVCKGSRFKSNFLDVMGYSKHHCRVCGLIYCDVCTDMIVVPWKEELGEIRCCDPCYRDLNRHYERMQVEKLRSAEAKKEAPAVVQANAEMREARRRLTTDLQAAQALGSVLTASLWGAPTAARGAEGGVGGAAEQRRRRYFRMREGYEVQARTRPEYSSGTTGVKIKPRFSFHVAEVREVRGGRRDGGFQTWLRLGSEGIEEGGEDSSGQRDGGNAAGSGNSAVDVDINALGWVFMHHPEHGRLVCDEVEATVVARQYPADVAVAGPPLTDLQHKVLDRLQAVVDSSLHNETFVKTSLQETVARVARGAETPITAAEAKNLSRRFRGMKNDARELSSWRKAARQAQAR